MEHRQADDIRGGEVFGGAPGHRAGQRMGPRRPAGQAQRMGGHRGVKFDMDSKNVKDGKTIAIYFADEVAGFAIHLVQK